jgi:hypothetical protein
MWLFCFGAWPGRKLQEKCKTGALRFEPENRYLKNVSCALPGPHD